MADVVGTWEFLSRCQSLSLRERAFLAVLRFGGLRKGEALGLEWRHVDPTANVLRVDQQRRKANALAVTRKLKSEAARRNVPMRTPLAQLLADLRRAGETCEVWTGRGGRVLVETRLVFPFREHELARVAAVVRGVDPASFPPGDCWHVFRHTLAVELVRAGKSVEYVHQWLGHSDLAKTVVYLRGLVGGFVDPLGVEDLDRTPPPVIGGSSHTSTGRTGRPSEASSPGTRMHSHVDVPSKREPQLGN